MGQPLEEIQLQYQIRRGGQVSPGLYSMQQLHQLSAAGTLLQTDEVAQEGGDMWVPLPRVLASAPQEAPAVAAPAPTGAAAAPAAGSAGDDWLMPAHVVGWVFRGCLMLLILTVVLPWWSVSAGGMSESWLGIVHWPGILVLLLAGAALGGTWAPIPHRQWLFVGAALCLFLTFIVLIGIGSPTPEPGGPSLVEGLSHLASRGVGLGWRGIGLILAFIASLGATTFGVFTFVQHLKQRPAL
ncbi:MAG: hypothetical protein MK101_08225 [Phycisphaerales bacterium]|nr:hypothetical protein [Phycisphaerales bacterium]